MIKEVIMYTVICDNCGADANKDNEIAAWNDKGYALDSAMESDWHKTDDDKHICDKCFGGFDDDDNVIIKKP